MKCLGPVESPWNLKSFEVAPTGCVGGRRLNLAHLPKDAEPIHFVDCTTVSRSHFEVYPLLLFVSLFFSLTLSLSVFPVPHSGQIRFDPVGKYYAIRDIGSAGGTFIRIPHGKKQLLTLGEFLLLFSTSLSSPAPLSLLQAPCSYLGNINSSSRMLRPTMASPHPMPQIQRQPLRKLVGTPSSWRPVRRSRATDQKPR
jgi:hypothetical protein